MKTFVSNTGREVGIMSFVSNTGREVGILCHLFQILVEKVGISCHFVSNTGREVGILCHLFQILVERLVSHVICFKYW